HSSAHIMAKALRRLFPNNKFGVGTAIYSGFYYDTDNGESPVTAEDLPAIEAAMMTIVKENNRIVRNELSRAEAVDFF
ncbi:threonine--tRNA ligase, partial [Enterococcus faecalis]